MPGGSRRVKLCVGLIAASERSGSDVTQNSHHQVISVSFCASSPNARGDRDQASLSASGQEVTETCPVRFQGHSRRFGRGLSPGSVQVGEDLTYTSVCGHFDHVVKLFHVTDCNLNILSVTIFHQSKIN